MPDIVRDPLAGPDSMYSTDVAVSRGQWHTLAVLALKVLRVPIPTSRYDATVAAVRLHRRLAEDSNPTNNER